MGCFGTKLFNIIASEAPNGAIWLIPFYVELLLLAWFSATASEVPNGVIWLIPFYCYLLTSQDIIIHVNMLFSISVLYDS